MTPTLEVNYFSNPVPAMKIDIFICDERPEDFAEWAKVVREVSPVAVIPPYHPTEAEWTSRAADLARGEFPDREIGVVVSGKSNIERRNFFMWAQQRGFSPITFLPHPRWDRTRVIMDLNTEHLIEEQTWIHFAGGEDDGFDHTKWPGIYTQSDAFA